MVLRRHSPIVTHALISQAFKEIISAWLVNYGCTSVNELVVQGLCAELATLVWEKLGRPAALEFRDCDLPVHTWLYFDGKHYDMLNPEGASTQAQMREFSRLSKRDLLHIAKGNKVLVDYSDKESLYIALGWSK